MSVFEPTEQRHISGAIVELRVAVERLGEAGVELAAAGRLGWAQTVAKLQASVEFLLDRVEAHR
jgi:hypothetical protein